MNISINNKKFVLFPLLIISLLLILFTISTSSAAVNIYVNGTSGNDSWDGTSSIYVSDSVGPKKSISNGVQTVDTDGTVQIANGIYQESSITISKNDFPAT